MTGDMANGFESLSKRFGYSGIVDGIVQSGCAAPEELIRHARTINKRLRTLKKDCETHGPDPALVFKLTQTRNELDAVYRLARNTVNYIKRELEKVPRG